MGGGGVFSRECGIAYFALLRVKQGQPTGRYFTNYFGYLLERGVGSGCLSGIRFNRDTVFAYVVVVSISFSFYFSQSPYSRHCVNIDFSHNSRCKI